MWVAAQRPHSFRHTFLEAATINYRKRNRRLVPVFDPLDSSDLPYEERELIQRAINGASGKHARACALDEDDLRACVPLPRWAIVKSLFCCGSTVATAICHRYGYDPERMIGKDSQENASPEPETGSHLLSSSSTF
jgi:hypothetical protein